MRNIILSIILVILTVGHLSAQLTPLSFEDALNMTMSSNPEITANQHQLKAAQQERRAAIGLRMPQVGITGTYVYMEDDIGVNFNNMKPGAKELFDGVVGSLGAQGIELPPPVLGAADMLFKKNWGLNIQERDFAMIAGSVKMPIYTGGKINAANRAARINEQAVREQTEQISNALVSELVERYYGLSLAHSVVQVRKQVLDAVRRHLDDAILLEKNGVIARSERLYMDVKVAEAERELLAAELQAKTISSALRNTINSKREYYPITNMFIMTRVESMEHFQSLAIENNPQLRQVGLQRDLAQENVVVMRSELLPQVVAMGGYNFYNHQVSKALPKWIVGAGVSINIFNGLNKEYKFSAAKHTVRRVESLKYKAENDIAVLVERLYMEMRNYADRVPSIEASLEFADEYLRVKKAAFKEGIASAVDVIDAELNLASTRVEKLQTAYYYDLMLARLLEASGVSGEFTKYQRSPNATQVRFE